MTAFEKSAESTTSYSGTGSDSGTTYYDVTSYVHIGGQKIPYNVATKVTVISAAYIESDYDEGISAAEDVFADTVLVDYGDTGGDLSAITGITDSPDDKAVISIDYAAPFDSDYTDLKDKFVTLAKDKDKN